MNTFPQMAKECADDASKFKKAFLKIAYVGYAMCVAEILFIFLGIFMGSLITMMVGVIFAPIFGYQAYLSHQQSRKSFNDCMEQRDECLDLAQKYRGY